jgi:hypothetical protein
MNHHISRQRLKQLPVQILLLLGCTVFTASCKKLVTVDPPVTEITGASVYSSDATAAAVLTGLYTNMSSAGTGDGLTSISEYGGLSADELSVYGSSSFPYYYYYVNALTSNNTGYSDFWNNIYPIVYTTNSAIQGLTLATALTPSIKQQLLGEAYFMRAFCYFYLVNLYGDVPLITGIDFNGNSVAARTPQSLVWVQIISDLKNAQTMLSSNYLDGSIVNITQERVRPTSWAATAMLARSYLYTEKWDSAASEATALINNNAVFNLDSLNDVFLDTSREAIWQLLPTISGQNTPDAALFVLPSSGPDGMGYPVYLDTVLVNTFEPGDERRINWIDSVVVGPTTYYYAYKYKVNVNPSPVSEYLMILRLGEQYLIRAEAEANNGPANNIAAAIADLNVIRARAGLSPYSGGTDQPSVLAAILHERQVELFTEWGHRWFDLKRTGNVNAVMGLVTPEKGGTWSSDWQLYPITHYELQHDPNLQQNPGYGN